MPNLIDALTAETKKNAVVDDCLALIDAEVAAKGGLMGFAIKAGYKTIQGIKPGFVRGVVVDLLPEFAGALDPLYQDAKAKGRTPPTSSTRIPHAWRRRFSPSPMRRLGEARAGS